MSETIVLMSAIIVAELLLVLIGLLGFAWLRNRAARRRDAKAIRLLVTRIRNTRTEREATIAQFLGDMMGLSGEALEQAKTAMLRAELVLLQRFAGVYKKRDAGAAAQFDIDLVAALAPYYQLQGGEDVVTHEQPADDSAELEGLRAENQRLSDELSVTMETMSRMLNEYSTMFAGGHPGEAAPIAALVGGAVAAASESDGDPEPTPDSEEVVRSTDVGTPAETAAGADFAAGLEVDEESGPDPQATVAEDNGDADDVVVQAQDDIDVLFAASGDDTQSDGPGNTEALSDSLDAVDEPTSGDGSLAQRIDAETVDESDVATETEAEIEIEAESAAKAEVGEETTSGVEVVAEGVVESETEANTAAAAEAEAGSEEAGDLFGDVAPEMAADGVAENNDEVTEFPDAGVVEDQPERPSRTTGESPEVAIEALETVAERLEEGATEVVSCDESDGFDVEFSLEEDDLFDSAESEIIVQAEDAAGDPRDNAGADEPVDLDQLFDGIDEAEALQQRSGH